MKRIQLGANSFGLLAFLAFWASTLTGCWRLSESTTLEENRSFLRFVGSVAGIELVLDDAPSVPLVGRTGKAAAEGTLWEILPGRHMVELHRGGEQILRRDLFVARGQTIDVAMPR